MNCDAQHSNQEPSDRSRCSALREFPLSIECEQRSQRDAQTSGLVPMSETTVLRTTLTWSTVATPRALVCNVPSLVASATTPGASMRRIPRDEITAAFSMSSPHILHKPFGFYQFPNTPGGGGTPRKTAFPESGSQRSAKRSPARSSTYRLATSRRYRVSGPVSPPKLRHFDANSVRDRTGKQKARAGGDNRKKEAPRPGRLVAAKKVQKSRLFASKSRLFRSVARTNMLGGRNG
jgi:hypothetical protein